MVCCTASAAFSASSSALRCASIELRRSAISASRRVCRSVTACSTSCWFAAQRRELGVELVADLLLLVLLALELGLLVLELRVDARASLFTTSLSVWLARSRSCWRRAASTASVASTSASSDVPGWVYAYTARWRAYSRSSCALALVAAIDSSSSADVLARLVELVVGGGERRPRSRWRRRGPRSASAAPRRGRRRSLRRPPSRGGARPQRGS